MARTKPTKKNVRPPEQGGTHEGLFHRTFSVPKNAASELQCLLAPDVVKRIQWDKLRKASDKFVDTHLTSRFSDILFEVEIDDEKAFIYVLLEHKSNPEFWTLMQLLEYMVRIWRQYLRESSDKPGKRLPLILPVVLHHGASGWTVPRRFIEYFGDVPQSLRAFVPNFGILLDDVAKVNLDKLRERPMTAEARLVLLCLRLGRTPELFFAELPRWEEVLVELWHGKDKGLVFTMIVPYLERVGDVPKAETVMALQKILKFSPAEEMIYIEEFWMQQGELKGERKGELKGTRAVLSKLLTQRFGPLAPNVTQRLQAATEAELDAMTLRILDAKTLDEVLDKPKRKRRA
ncbi:MAG TPA: Rpn family recombination-promoting nuclease/putative transposase [Polyangium sp.]|nr:Rpn family recombination-promoting nuclease/putative transposase [Polyangium sp.]